MGRRRGRTDGESEIVLLLLVVVVSLYNTTGEIIETKKNRTQNIILIRDETLSGRQSPGFSAGVVARWCLEEMDGRD